MGLSGALVYPNHLAANATLKLTFAVKTNNTLIAKKGNHDNRKVPVTIATVLLPRKFLWNLVVHSREWSISTLSCCLLYFVFQLPSDEFFRYLARKNIRPYARPRIAKGTEKPTTNTNSE